jgi:hypothetical protein
MDEVKKEEIKNEETNNVSKDEKKKVSLADFKMKSFVTKVKVDQMQFLKTAGG